MKRAAALPTMPSNMGNVVLLIGVLLQYCRREFRFATVKALAAAAEDCGGIANGADACANGDNHHAALAQARQRLSNAARRSPFEVYESGQRNASPQVATAEV